MAALPQGWRPDLVVTIQSGVPPIENIDWLACPTAYISVDTWHDFAEMIHARPYDFVFAAQREFAAHFANAGCAHAFWLPLACDPDAHRPVECRKDYDISFVGSTERLLHAQRIARLERLAERHSVLVDTALDCEAMSRAVCRGRLAFNSSVAQDVNMRVFEAMAMGVPLLTNRDADANGLLDLFRDGEHLIAYDDTDIEHLAGHYIATEDARQRVAAAARNEVLAKHTYLHRVQTLLDVVSSKIDWERFRAQPLLRGHGSLENYLPIVQGTTAEWIPQRPQSAEAYDTVIAVSNVDGRMTREAFADARSMLRTGGTLVAGLSRDDVRELSGTGQPGDAWAALEPLGFVVLRMELRDVRDEGEVYAFVFARRRDCTLKDIAREVYSRNPIPGLSLEETIARVP